MSGNDQVMREATGAHLLHAPSRRLEALRYAIAGALVLGVAAAVALVPHGAPQVDDASEVDAAVLIDLPPALAAAEPKREANDGPEQQASEASTATSAPPPVDPPKTDPTKPDLTKPDPTKPDPTPPAPDTPPVDVPPPPPAPDPAAVLAPKAVEVTPPQPAAAAAAPQQVEQAPAGSEQPVKREDATGEDDRPHPSARAMSAWQRSMVSRLEVSKRALRHQPGHEGTVVVAFAITHSGALASARVARGSGDPSVDAMAKSLVERAAPFPAPPAGATARELSFTVPIRFRR